MEETIGLEKIVRDVPKGSSQEVNIIGFAKPVQDYIIQNIQKIG